MTFAWQGFTLDHPEDWAPVTLTGTRNEGYVRIASPGRLSYQIRWKASPEIVDLSSVLDAYLDRLQTDAKRAKAPFKRKIESDEGCLTYLYTSSTCGRGAILQSTSSSRVFFLEAISTKNESLLPHIKKLLASFQENQDWEHWALFGLHIRVPQGLQVEKKVLEAGRTTLVLAGKKARVEVQRWGFAEQLVAKHGLEPWSRSLLGLPNCPASACSFGIEFTQPGRITKPPVNALVQVQPDRNQIITVKVETRDPKWRPIWDWLI